MPDLEYISLKNNNLERIESYFFFPVRLSPIRELNLHTCNLRSLGAKTFQYLPYLEHVDFFNNPFLMVPPDDLKFGSSISRAMIRMNEEYFRSLGLGATNQMYVPSLSAFFLRRTLSRLNMSKNYIQDVGKFPQMENLTELILEDNRIRNIEEKAFDKLHSIKFIDLSKNQLPG